MTRKPTVYIETTIISAYFDFKRQDDERKSITRQFWKQMPQLKIPSPAEIELDKIRDIIWRREARRNPERLFELIRREAREIEKEFAIT